MAHQEYKTEYLQNAEHDIRHLLALDRTRMANERTLLAYIRTSLTLLVPAVSFLYFTHNKSLFIAGILLMPIGFATLVFGILSFEKKKKHIKADHKLMTDLLQLQYLRAEKD